MLENIRISGVEIPYTKERYVYLQATEASCILDKKGGCDV